MNVFFRFHRNAPGALELVWRDLLTEMLGLAFQRHLWTSFYSERKTLKPKGSPKTKNPASSAGHSHPFFQWLRAKLDKVYPVLVGASL